MFENDPSRRAAHVENAIRYMGAACPTCDSGDRYTSNGNCVACTKARASLRQQLNPPPRVWTRADKWSPPALPADGRCECCSRPGLRLVADHDHTLEALGARSAQTFRGWICYRCNVGLGCLGDNADGLTKATEYLIRHQQRS